MTPRVFCFDILCAVVLPLPPSANRYWRRAGSRLYRSAEAAQYIEHVGYVMRTAGIETKHDADVAVVADVYMTRGDLDNRVKVLLDALSGSLYADDRQVSEIHIVRHRCSAGEQRVVLSIIYQQ